MQTITAGVTPSGQGLGGRVWHILGQTYTPMQHSESCMAWHAIFPPGTFVPPHMHPDQDEFIYVLNGRFDLLLGGNPATAGTGDLIRLVRGIPHGIFNKSAADVTCLFWVTPTARLWDLFEKIDNQPDPAEITRLGREHGIFFEPPPG